jgi:hypothetical protein
MPYNVKNSAGTTIATVPDRSIDTETTSLSLIGYNVTNYGLAHAENFVRLLENFANDVAPENPITGQLWYDTNAEILKLYINNQWVPVNESGSPSVGGNSFENGLSGAYHLALVSPATSILLFFAGGKIVSAMAKEDISAISLPANVVIEDTTFPLSARFPNGIKAGHNLADDAEGYEFTGKVAIADQSLFVGGGDANKPAGLTYIDLGADTLPILFANGQIIAVLAQTAIPNGSLPNTVSVSVKLANSTIETTNMVFRSAFPSGLIGGMNYASGFSRYGNDTLISALAGLSTAASQAIYFTGANAPATYPISAFGRSLTNMGDAAAARTLLGVNTTTGLLSAIGALSPSNNQGLLFTGSETVTTYNLSAFGRTLTASNDAAAARSTLGALINALGSLSTSNNLGMYFTGSTTIGTFPFSPLGRSLVGANTNEDARAIIGGVGNFGVANTSDIISGTAGDRVITPAALSGLPKSMTTSGYKMFQDGFVIQWGPLTPRNGEGSIAQSFPLTFPNNVFCVIPIIVNASSNGEHDFHAQLTFMNTSSFSSMRNSSDGDSGQTTGYYIAIGN